ncbi:tudor domain-containing protein 5 [Heteronotia binoei]|uniref:tudor domain-containing protein 5 n=1 Tax=Heteronotia binoei TaxID=13085 RepID=UPI00292E64D7|nr:tudor domain-containing protein 5 [Heteronotia binoei]XP_060088488.1 tudor domain-containing protein 5 [Heteronotia binoei]
MSDQERMMSSLKKKVRSLLIAFKGGLTPVELEKQYRSMIGEQLPYRALGYQSTKELVMDMPDVVYIHCGGDGSVVLKAVVDESTVGIASLVARQKDKSRSHLPRPRPKNSLGNASCPNRPFQTQMPRRLPRRGRVPPTLPAVVKSQLKELLRSSPVLLSDFNKAFAHHFGRNFEFMRYGFFSMSEVLNTASDIITVEQTRAGSLLTLKKSPSIKKELEKLSPSKGVIQPNHVKQTLPPIGSAPTRSPAPSQPTLSSVGSAPTRSLAASQPTLLPVGSAPTRSPAASQPTLLPVGSAPTCSPAPSLLPIGSAPTRFSSAPTRFGSAPTRSPTRSPAASQPTLLPVGSAPTCSPASSLLPIGSAPTRFSAPNQSTLLPIGSAPTCSPAPRQPTQNQNQTPSQLCHSPIVQSKPEETPVVKCDKMKQLQKQMKTVLSQRGLGGTVSSQLKEKIKTIAAQHPEGLPVYRLPSEFEAHFKEMLPLRELGFLSLMEFVGALSDVLHIECTEGGQNWRIFDSTSHCLADSKKTLNDDETNQEISLSGSLAHEDTSDKCELPCWDFPPEGLKNLEPKLNVITKIVKPHLGMEEPDIMQEIMQEEIPPDAVQDRHLHRLPQLESATLVGLYVEYMISPSQFYVQFYGAETFEKLEDMMIEMRRCYASKNVADRYIMPEASVKPGQLCCIKNLQDKWWYRGIIHCVHSDQEVEVFYLDFGNMGTVPKSHLRFLKDCYANLPAQAVPCCLAQMQPAKGNWTADAILEFQKLCGLKLLVGVVDEYIDGVLHLFLCDTSSDEDIYFHKVLRLEGHAVICRENIPSKGFREFNPSYLYLKPSPEPKGGLEKASSFLQGLPETASSEPCKNEVHSQRCNEKKEDLPSLKPEQWESEYGSLDVSAKKSCVCKASNPCKDSPENPGLVSKEQTSQTKDPASPGSVLEMPYLEPVCLYPEVWDEDWIPLLSVEEEKKASTCNNLCSDVAVFSSQTCINEGRKETQHNQELEQQTTDPPGSLTDCVPQTLEEFYVSIVHSQQSTDLSQMALDANKLFACNSQPLLELCAFPVDKCNGEASLKKKEDNASRTQLVPLSTPRPCCVQREGGHNNALAFTAELQGSPVFFIPYYSPSAALGASARLVASGRYFCLNRRKLDL